MNPLRALLTLPSRVVAAHAQRFWESIQPLSPGTEWDEHCDQALQLGNGDEPIPYRLTDMASVFTAADIRAYRELFLRDQQGIDA